MSTWWNEWIAKIWEERFQSRKEETRTNYLRVLFLSCPGSPNLNSPTLNWELRTFEKATRILIKTVTPRPEGPTRGNRRVTLNRSQFPETHSRPRKAHEISQPENKTKIPTPEIKYGKPQKNKLTLEIYRKFGRVPFVTSLNPLSRKKTVYTQIFHNIPIRDIQQQKQFKT